MRPGSRFRHRRPLVRPCLLAASWLLAGAAWAAGPYGFVDGRGVAHVSDQPVDARYEPLLPERNAPAVRVPGKTMDRASLLTWLEFAPEAKALQPELRRAAQLSGVDVELLKAVILVESGFKADLVSPAGAIGLMQLMPAAGERYATRAERAGGPVESRLRDPRHNILVGARMLADLWRRLGSIDAALAAWNAGETRVRRAGNRVPEIAETQAHVHQVLELYWSLLQQRQARQARQLLVSTAVAPAHRD